MNLHEWANRWGVSVQAFQELMNLMAVEGAENAKNEGQDTLEQQVQQEIRLHCSQLGGVAWRNNSGALQTQDGRWVRFGVGNESKKLNAKYKSPDLFCLTPMTGGKLVLPEVKRPGWTGPTTEHEFAQAAFLTHAISYGAIGGFVTSVNDFRKLIGVQ